MPAYTHIACCVDTGDAGGDALAASAAMWTGRDVRLSAVHAAPPEEVMRGGLTEWEVDPAEPYAPVARWLDELAARHSADPVLLRGHAPHDAVLEWLPGSGADLAVAAAHSGRVARALMGSFATELAYRAPVDTLILPPSQPVPAGPVRRVVCAVDDGPDSDHALRASRRLAEVGGAQVEIVHVVQPPVPVGKDLVAGTLPMPGGRADEAERIVADARDRSGIAGATTRVLAGSADGAIGDRAREAGADVLVLGPRSGGRPGLGGVASSLIRSAPCAVLLARGD